MRKAILLSALALSLSLAAASSAHGAQRYVTTTGSGFACTQVAPCGLVNGVNAAGLGDEVIIAPGVYATATSLNIGGSDVHGAAGGAKPLIQTTAAPGFNLGGTDSKLSDVRIEHTTAGSSYAILADGNSVVSRVQVTSNVGACGLVGSAVIRDSLCIGGSDFSEAGLVSYPGAFSSVTARNVTARGASGLLAGSGSDGANITVNLKNVILDGTGFDITTLHALPTISTTISASNSNYSTVNPAPGGTSTITPAGSGSNQIASPLYVDAASGDYHPAAGSPTIDAGAPDSLTGTTDLDGIARPQGAAFDIGAYEYVAPVTPPDTTPPATAIDKGPKAKTKSRKAKFVFSSSEPGSTFTCKVDTKPQAPCTSPLKLKRLKKGKHKLTVVATDAAGNADATPAKYRWKVKKPKR